MGRDADLDTRLAVGPLPQRVDASEEGLDVGVAEPALAVCGRTVGAVPTVAVVSGG